VCDFMLIPAKASGVLELHPPAGPVARRAASVAGLLLTTEVMIADAPKDDADHGHGGPPGGMGGMGDMGM
jgi:chaperonin GroEL